MNCYENVPASSFPVHVRRNPRPMERRGGRKKVLLRVKEFLLRILNQLLFSTVHGATFDEAISLSFLALASEQNLPSGHEWFTYYSRICIISLFNKMKAIFAYTYNP